MDKNASVEWQTDKDYNFKVSEKYCPTVQYTTIDKQCQGIKIVCTCLLKERDGLCCDTAWSKNKTKALKSPSNILSIKTKHL